MGEVTNNGMFGLVVKITVGFVIVTAAIFFVFANQEVAQDSGSLKSTLLAEATVERLAPTGQVRTKVDQAEKPSEQAVAPAKSAESIVNSVCSSCHGAGILGAPKVKNDADWVERNKKGLEGLVTSAIAGIGNMPARGGSSLSDEEIAMAVKYMSGL